jgi:plasmid maintenance system antidote protein VapI
LNLLRGAIRTAGKSVYAVSKEARVSQAILSRFLRGQRTLTLETADRLCQTLGLELRRANDPGRS